jgi:hypothetical protein
MISRDMVNDDPAVRAQPSRHFGMTRDARAMLKEARSLVGHVTDRSRRARLERAAQQIEVPLTQATQAGHAFVYDDLEERLNTARRRLGALFEELANPPRLH